MLLFTFHEDYRRVHNKENEKQFKPKTYWLTKKVKTKEEEIKEEEE